MIGRRAALIHHFPARLGPANPAETLAALLHPGHWLLEAGCRPPSAHSRTAGPSLASACGMAVSLRTASLLPLMLGCLLIDRVEAAGCPIGPLGGLALHEIITNAAIHGNLAVHTGRALQWEDLVLRQQRIETALTDPLYADRLVTIVLAWNARGLRAAVLDEGAGYAAAPPCAAEPGAPRAAGRGLVIAREAARVTISQGGRCTRLDFARAEAEAGP